MRKRGYGFDFRKNDHAARNSFASSSGVHSVSRSAGGVLDQLCVSPLMGPGLALILRPLSPLRSRKQPLAEMSSWITKASAFLISAYPHRPIEPEDTDLASEA